MRRIRQGFGALTAIASVLLLSACAETQLTSAAVKSVTAPSAPVSGAAGTSQGAYKVGDPYQIDGVWYYPKEDYNYDETGIASWYGPNFHGRSTANGEIFDQNDVSAAHRTLPLPSLVRVTNLDNGRVLEVRINDRGPYSHGRILDLSRRAAQLLGYENSGTAKVRVQILADESKAMKLALLQHQPPALGAPRTQVASESLPTPVQIAPTAPPGVGPGFAEVTLIPAKSVAAIPPVPVVPAAPAVSATPIPARPSVVAGGPASIPTPLPSAPREGPTSAQLAQQPVRVIPVHGASRMYIQAGAFSVQSNATTVVQHLAKVGHAQVTRFQTKAGNFYRVRLGPFNDLEQADAALEKVIGTGYPEARLVVD